MQELRILALHHAKPDVTSITTLFFKKLLPVLQDKIKVHMIWVIYSPNKISWCDEQDANTTLINIHDYENALDLIKKMKIDIVYADPWPNFIFNAFSSAAKYLGIPVMGIFDFTISDTTNKKSSFMSNIGSFFQRSLPGDTHENKEKFMKRGRFLIYKYLFLLRTQRAMNVSLSKIIQELFLYLKYFFQTKYPLYPQFACDIHFLDNENLVKPLVDAGFNKSSLIVTGSPIHDSIFQEIQQRSKTTIKNDDRIHVLLITTGLYEHGIWTKNQRDSIIKGIAREISNHNEKMSLVIKIHPSSENLLEYRNLINPVNPSIRIYQEGNLLDFLEKADVVLGFISESALIHALLYGKPIVICNFYDLKNDLLLERGLVQECKEFSSIISSIHDVLHSHPATKDGINEYIKDYHYKLDGLAAARISDAILSLLHKASRDHIS